MLKVYTLDDSQQWDKIVCSFKEYDVYWLSGYVRAFHLHGDGTPLLFYFEGGNTRGIHVVMRRDVGEDESFWGLIPTGVFFDFVSPYGYGGWLIEGEETGELFAAYGAWIKKHNIISEFVRFHPVIRNHERCSDFYVINKMGEVVCMDLESSEAIGAQVVSANRNKIRKARKNGVRIFHGSFPDIYVVFKEIYDETMDRDCAKSYYYFNKEFYQSILEDLPYNAQVFWAKKDSNVIAASIILCVNGYMNYHLSGSRKEYISFAPMNLLLYEAAQWGYANGYKSFYLGGGVGSENDSLLQFKKSFNKKESGHFFVGKKIHNKECYEELMAKRKLNVIDEANDYFPAYRR